MYRCEDPEESYESSEEIGKKYGIKYITSPLAIGTLVWAKMHGYCRLVANLLELTNLPPPPARSRLWWSTEGNRLCL